MHLAGAAMVRDEADIIEAFVRHNLRQLERLAIVDHGSVDGTFEILTALRGEGLQVSIERDDSPAQRQQETLTRLARTLLRDGADLVFALDADEFLKISSPALLARVVTSVPHGMHMALDWQTYVPSCWLETGTNPLAIALQRLARERHGLYKVAVTKHFLDMTDTTIGPGSHTVLRIPGPEILPLARVNPEIAALAHLPVRSARQLFGKVKTGWAAHVAAERDNPDLASHWRELNDEFAAGTLPPPDRLAMIAANYGLPMAEWQVAGTIATVADPLVAFALRYTELARPK